MKPALVPYPRKITYIGGVSRVTQDTPVFASPGGSHGGEGYSLSVDNGKVHIEYSAPAGEFYARRTLQRIIDTCGGECDNLIIEDSPVLEFRSFMVDSCRHFYGKDELKKLIDTAADFRFNKFHWHLTDDQGWRVEIKKYPLLTEIGSVRKDSTFGGVIEGKEHGGFFTQEDISEIVAYCAQRHIEIIPEVDIPGHFTAALAAYPQFGCKGEAPEIKTLQGIFANVLCAGNDDAVRFAKDILDEICALFPGRYIHIGGDEAPRTHWEECEKCSAKARELGENGYDKLQGKLMKELADYLAGKGKKAITWNESLKGGIIQPGDVTVQRWMDNKNLCSAFAQAGGEIIESDFYHYYCDYPYGMTPLKKTFSYNPYAKCGDAVKGIEAPIWTEYIRTFDDLCQKLYPRAAAAAERAWSGYPSRRYKDFESDFIRLIPLLEKSGISQLPPAKWNLPFYSRLGDILGFFRGSILSFLHHDD